MRWECAAQFPGHTDHGDLTAAFLVSLHRGKGFFKRYKYTELKLSIQTVLFQDESKGEEVTFLLLHHKV